MKLFTQDAHDVAVPPARAVTQNKSSRIWTMALFVISILVFFAATIFAVYELKKSLLPDTFQRLTFLLHYNRQLELILTIALVLLFVRLLYRIEQRKIKVSFALLGISAFILALTLLVSNLVVTLPNGVTVFGIISVYVFWLITTACIVLATPKLHDIRLWVAIIASALLAIIDPLAIAIFGIAAMSMIITYGSTKNIAVARIALHWLLTLFSGFGLAFIVVFSAIRFSSRSGIDFDIQKTLTALGSGHHSLKVISYSTLPTPSFSPVTITAVIAAIAIAIFSSTLTFRLLQASISNKPTPKQRLPFGPVLSIMLIYSVIVAAVASITFSRSVSLSIGMAIIAFSIASVTYVRFMGVPRMLLPTSIFISMLFVSFGAAWHGSLIATSSAPYRDNTHSLAHVSQSLADNHVTYILTNTWGIPPLPANMPLSKRPVVLPLTGCSDTLPQLARDVKVIGVYIKDGSRCFEHKLRDTYGSPLSTFPLASNSGTASFYLFSTTRNAPKKPIDPSIAVIKEIEDTISPQCNGKTIVAVVAHQDDDLLFMNPAILNHIQAGYCIRTVYVTAGDFGYDKSYWLSRRKGSEAAYNTMLGTPDKPWSESTFKLANKTSITTSGPVDNQTISHIFINIPDGNVQGQGFGTTGFGSLEHLQNHHIESLTTVDGTTTYNSKKLIETLASIIKTYQPSEVWSQSFSPLNSGDHSDHIATGVFTKKAYDILAQQDQNTKNAITLFYIGYPIRNLPVNISEEETQAKRAIFETYAGYDFAICKTGAVCDAGSGTYEDYLYRQYTDK